MKEIKCTVVGKVQMVLFRDFVQRHARKLSLCGTVRNLTDGSLEVVAQGEKEKLEKFILLLHTGSFLSHVIRVDVVWREPTRRFDSFTIVY